MKLSWIILGIAVLAAVVLVAWSYTRPEATLTVTQPRVGSISEFVEEQGVTELPHSYLVAMPINGWLERITLREGDQVKKGDVVARLEKDNLESRRTQAQQRVTILQSQLEEIDDNRLEDSYYVQAQKFAQGMTEMIESARANIDSLKALKLFTSAEKKRLTKLIGTGATTESDLDRINMEHDRATADLRGETFKFNALVAFDAASRLGPKLVKDYIDRKKFTHAQRQGELVDAQEMLAMAERDIQRSTMEAPEDAVVLQRHQTRRQFLSAGTPLLTLGNLDDLEVTAEILTERAMKIEPGDTVEVYGEGIPEGTSGTVLRVYPAGFKKISSLGVEQQRVKVAVKLEQVPPRLGVDFRVYVRIYYEASKDAITIPRTSLVRATDGGWNVILVRDGRTEIVPVTVGLMNDSRVQITKGIAKDDLVVIRPDRHITTGMRVETIKE